MGEGGSGELFGLVAGRLIMIIAPRQWIRSGGADHPTRSQSGQPPSASSRDPCALSTGIVTRGMDEMMFTIARF
jgi:hypothetical protein